MDKHIFFSVLTSVLQDHSETAIRYLIILKAKFGANFVTLFYWRKTSKLEKIKIMKFYKIASSTLLRKFIVISLKLNKLFEI